MNSYPAGQKIRLWGLGRSLLVTRYMGKQLKTSCLVRNELVTIRAKSTPSMEITSTCAMCLTLEPTVPKNHKTVGFNFINVKHTRFLNECHFGSFSYVHMYLHTYVHTQKKAAKMRFVQKARKFNIDEIDGRIARLLDPLYPDPFTLTLNDTLTRISEKLSMKCPPLLTLLSLL